MLRGRSDKKKKLSDIQKALAPIKDAVANAWKLAESQITDSKFKEVAKEQVDLLLKKITDLIEDLPKAKLGELSKIEKRTESIIGDVDNFYTFLSVNVTNSTSKEFELVIKDVKAKIETLKEAVSDKKANKKEKKPEYVNPKHDGKQQNPSQPQTNFSDLLHTLSGALEAQLELLSSSPEMKVQIQMDLNNISKFLREKAPTSLPSASAERIDFFVGLKALVTTVLGNQQKIAVAVGRSPQSNVQVVELTKKVSNLSRVILGKIAGLNPPAQSQTPEEPKRQLGDKRPITEETTFKEMLTYIKFSLDHILNAVENVTIHGDHEQKTTKVLSDVKRIISTQFVNGADAENTMQFLTDNEDKINKAIQNLLEPETFRIEKTIVGAEQEGILENIRSSAGNIESYMLGIRQNAKKLGYNEEAAKQEERKKELEAKREASRSKIEALRAQQAARKSTSELRADPGNTTPVEADVGAEKETKVDPVTNLTGEEAPNAFEKSPNSHEINDIDNQQTNLGRANEDQQPAPNGIPSSEAAVDQTPAGAVPSENISGADEVQQPAPAGDGVPSGEKAAVGQTPAGAVPSENINGANEDQQPVPAGDGVPSGEKAAVSQTPAGAVPSENISGANEGQQPVPAGDVTSREEAAAAGQTPAGAVPLENINGANAGQQPDPVDGGVPPNPGVDTDQQPADINQPGNIAGAGEGQQPDPADGAVTPSAVTPSNEQLDDEDAQLAAEIRRAEEELEETENELATLGSNPDPVTGAPSPPPPPADPEAEAAARRHIQSEAVNELEREVDQLTTEIAALDTRDASYSADLSGLVDKSHLLGQKTFQLTDSISELDDGAEATLIKNKFAQVSGNRDEIEEDLAGKRAVLLERLTNEADELKEDMKDLNVELAAIDPTAANYNAVLSNLMSISRQLQEKTSSLNTSIEAFGDDARAIKPTLEWISEQLVENDGVFARMREANFIEVAVNEIINGYDRDPTADEIARGVAAPNTVVSVPSAIDQSEQEVIAAHVNNRLDSYTTLINRYAHELEAIEHSNTQDSPRFKEIMKASETLRIQLEIFKRVLDEKIQDQPGSSRNETRRKKIALADKNIDKLDQILMQWYDKALSPNNQHIAHFSDDATPITGATPAEIQTNIQSQVDSFLERDNAPPAASYAIRQIMAGQTLHTTPKFDPTGHEYEARVTRRKSDDGRIRVAVHERTRDGGSVATIHRNTATEGGSKTRRLGYILPDDFVLQSAIDELNELTKFTKPGANTPVFALQGTLTRQEIQAYLIAGRILGVPVINQTRLKVDISSVKSWTSWKVNKAEERLKNNSSTFKQMQSMSKETTAKLEGETVKQEKDPKERDIRRPTFRR